MNWLDLLLALIICGSVAAGLLRGFVRTVVGLVTTILAVLLSTWFYGSAGSVFLEYVSHRGVANFLGFGIVFGTIILTGVVFSRLMSRLLRWAGLGWLDRVLGGMLGLARAWLVSAAIVLGLCAFTRNPPPAAVTQSRIAPYVLEVSNAVSLMAPKELQDAFKISYDKVKNLWKQVLKQVPRSL
ncbi:MAG: CvpA family protein [Bryobacteraceae bacterium]